MTPTTVACNNTVTVSGHDWPASTILTISIPQLEPTYFTPVTVTTDVTGAFSGVQLYIPSNAPTGTDNVSVQAGSATPISETLNVTCSSPATPSIQAQPSEVSPGGTVSVTGTGFPSSQNVTLTIAPQGGASILSQTVVSTSAGAISASLTLPVGAGSGTYTVSAQVASVTAATSTFQVAAGPQVTSVTPNPASPGSTVTLNGIDFAPSTSVTANLTCGSAITPTSGTVSTSGQLTLSFVVPTTAISGQCTIQIFSGSTTVATATLQVQQSSSVTVSPASAPAGTSVTVTGNGLTPGASVTAQAVFTLGGGTTQTSTQSGFVGSTGSVTLTLAIPANVLPGTYNINIYQNGAPQVAATATVTVTQPASIQVIPSTQIPGASSYVTVSGAGFQAYESVSVAYLASLTGGGQQQISVVGQASSTGSISVSLPVPANIVGGTTYTVTAVGATSQINASTTLTVSLNPQLILNPTSATSGSTVSVSGQNFPPNATVTITAQIPLANGASQSVSQTVQASTSGTFVLQVPILSAAASSSVTFTATANALSNGQSYAATATLGITNVPASISVNTSQAAPGTQIAVSGLNFAPGPNNLITVNLVYTGTNGQETASQTIDSSSSGSFSTVVTVPTDALTNSAVITASQASSGISASTSINVQAPLPTSTPTNTPVPPTNTPTATPIPPTPTQTPVPPTPTPAPTPVYLKFKWTSIWYHTVRVGTFDHLTIQTNKKLRLPATLAINFPSGRSVLLRGRTTVRGRWDITFPVLASAFSRVNHVAHLVVTVRRNHVAVADLFFYVIR